MNEFYSITIGRQLGSGGLQIGKMLSERLAIHCYDKELIQLASSESGLSKEFFEKVDERSSRSFFSGLFGFRAGYIGDSSGNYLTNESLFNIQSNVISELANNESCIFVGRCADYILREKSKCLSIFITANLDDRIDRIRKDTDMNREDALALIERTDKKRAGYYNYFSNKTWGMSTSYDLCINTSVFSMDEIIHIVTDYVRKHYLS